jgi:spermidine synthase
MYIMKTYLGTFLIAFTTLALEITLTRLLSAVAWYHLAFFAISTAMLGMTIGSTLVYLRPQWFTPAVLHTNLAKACLGYALSVPLSLIVLCVVPLYMTKSIMGLATLVIVTVACAVPFTFSGMVLSVVLTQYPLPIGRLYFSDLLGASLGCLLVLGGLEVLDAPSLILLCGALGIVAAMSFAWKDPNWTWQRRSTWALALMLIAVTLNAATPYGIAPVVAKGKVVDPATSALQKWNSFSWVNVSVMSLGAPQLWGPSPLTPKDEQVTQALMVIDGEAGTTLRQFNKPADIEHLRYDVTNFVYYLRPHGGACIIGVGGGRDLQSAILFGQEQVTAVDVNPVFIDILQNKYRDFAGVADHPGVTLQVAEARTFLSQSPEQYSVIQMSLIDTWAATGAGAFSFTENALYTQEAWQLFIERLKDDGIFTVSRWYSTNNLGETGRTASLAMATLYRMGISDPAQHIVMVTTDRVSTLLISRKPFSAADHALIQQTADKLQYTVAIMPGEVPANPILKKIMQVHSNAELDQTIANEKLNYTPSTDEQPYFFNLLRLDKLEQASDLYLTGVGAEQGVVQGNITATLTLLALILSLLYIASVTILIPLIIKERSKGKAMPQVLWSGAFYFSLIGAGFMMVEIALIQRLSIFLGHPAYALGILLFTIIFSTSIGSLISERLPLTRKPWVFVYPLLTAAVIIAERFALTPLITNWMTQPLLTKALAAIAIIFPLGILLGCFFPIGMRLVKSANAVETPWYWALNGIFGVLCSALAVFISIYIGISTNFYISAACYTLVVFSLYRIVQHSNAAQKTA